MVGLPRVVIAAPGSGHGKTTVATGLMGALRAEGLEVAGFKVGPDYIDPGYHTLAAGRPGRNLDPVLVGEHRIAPLFRHGAAGAEVAVVEGVMGLFDGRLADGHGSTAHVAGLLGAPVVLVVDCRGQSRSVAALLRLRAEALAADGFGDVEGFAADLVALEADPGRHDLAWRYRLGPEVLDRRRHTAELGNWLRGVVLPGG